MEWTDDGILLAARKHGESSLIIQMLTAEHGRHAGLVRGGAGRRVSGQYQPGNQLRATWRARLSEHLGSYRCDLIESRTAVHFTDPLRLAGISALCTMLEMCLPERQPVPTIYRATLALADNMAQEDWPQAYIAWEIGLLSELGFGLDLQRCAATGRNDQLAFVSPKSGRAVSLSAGEPYRDRLLPLPAFLLGSDQIDPGDLTRGMALSGYFLEQQIFHPAGHQLPAARERLAKRIADFDGP